MTINGYAKEGCDPQKAVPPIAFGVGFGKAVLGWLHGQWRRNVALGRANAIPDYLLADAGVERGNTDWIADERVKRLRLGANW